MPIIIRFMLAAMAALLISTSASYADSLPSSKKQVKAEQQDAFSLPPTVVAASWSGCHVSTFGGAVAGVMDPGFGVDGYLYGLGIGCDMQLNRIVLGAGTDYSWMHVSQFGGVNAREWSLFARAGVLVNDSTLLYGLVSRPQLTIAGMNNIDGIGWGGGIETRLAQNWSADLQYREETYDKLPGAREHLIRFGINFAFPVPGMPK